MKSLWTSWRGFWFEEASCVPMSLFRIFIGILILQMIYLHTANAWLDWYGDSAIASLNTVHKHFWNNNPTFDLMLLLPQKDFYVWGFLYFFEVATVCLTIGLFTHFSSAMVFFCILSLHHHQPYNINGGDAFLRMASMLLMFSYAGRALSVDRLIDRFVNIEPKSVIAPVWAQRLMQLQTSIAYWHSFDCKISGAQWLDGTAVYYSTRLDDLIRLSLPLYNSLLFCKLLAWYTLFVEGAMFTLVWFKELRYYILALAVVLHLGIDFSINLPVFEWAFMASFINFVCPEDLSKLMKRIRHYAIKLFGRPVSLRYNNNAILAMRLVSVTKGLDIFRLLRYFPFQAPDQSNNKIPMLFSLQEKGRILQGNELMGALSRRLPLLWPLAPIFGLISSTTSRKELPKTA